VEIEFDPVKEAANLVKHGLSLSRARDLDIYAIVPDNRYDEVRYRLYGLIDEVWHCAAIAERGKVTRVISLRRAHLKEVRRYVRST